MFKTRIILYHSLALDVPITFIPTGIPSLVYTSFLHSFSPSSSVFIFSFSTSSHSVLSNLIGLCSVFGHIEPMSPGSRPLYQLFAAWNVPPCFLHIRCLSFKTKCDLTLISLQRTFFDSPIWCSPPHTHTFYISLYFIIIISSALISRCYFHI